MKAFNMSKVYFFKNHARMMDCSSEGCADGDCDCDVVDGEQTMSEGVSELSLGQLEIYILMDMSSICHSYVLARSYLT